LASSSIEFPPRFLANDRRRRASIPLLLVLLNQYALKLLLLAVLLSGPMSLNLS
jgi:hypothetical protein